VVVATFRVGTRLAGYGTDCHASKMFSALLPGLVCRSLLLSPTHLILDLPLSHSSCYALLSRSLNCFVCCMHKIYSISMVSGSVRGYRYTWSESILQDVPQMCCWVLYTLYNRSLKITLLRVEQDQRMCSVSPLSECGRGNSLCGRENALCGRDDPFCRVWRKQLLSL